jgi:hypothetical protein
VTKAEFLLMTGAACINALKSAGKEVYLSQKHFSIGSV